MPDNFPAEPLRRPRPEVLGRLPRGEIDIRRSSPDLNVRSAWRAPNSGDPPNHTTYSDSDFWPVKCPTCEHGFMEKIGQIKSRFVSRCPSCESDFRYEKEQFCFELSEARNGRYNPWWEILRDLPSE
jgi:hypothetical protein